MLQKLALGGSLISSLYFLNQKTTKCCGIIGIVSEKRDNIAETLSLGVELLKNRGYDSAGVVTFSQEANRVEDHCIKLAEDPREPVNCIERLVQTVNKNIIRSQIGIGHTRWATCGEKVERNAHPHFNEDKSVYIVHNGIIGGHSSIKKNHLEGFHFTSETDTEVIAQLLGKFRNQGKTMLESIKETEKIMRETSENPQWGIVIIDKREPKKMWTTTNGSPIIVGMNDKEIFVASEIIAFQKESDCYFVTGDGETFELDISKIEELKETMNSSGRLKYFNHNEKNEVMVKPPKPFNSFYSYEITQQATIEFKPEFERIQSLQFGEYLTLIACGSSMYAAMASQFFFKKLGAFSKVLVYDPMELSEGDIIPQETVVLISQSGETKDLLNVVDKCKKIEAVKTIGIINVEGSTLARKVDFPIYIKVGREISVAATKSMFHQMLNLIMLAIEIGTKKESCPSSILLEMKKELLEIPNHVMESIKSSNKNCEQIAQLLYKKQSIYLLAMRETMAIAKEAALKIKELNYIHAEALGACEMKHGPIALIESEKPKETAIILFIFDNDTFEVCANAYDQMNSRNALIIIVTDCREKICEHYSTKNKKKMEESKTAEVFEEKDKEFIFMDVPKLKHFSSLLSLIPMQILVEKISELKKINPDMPRNLAKTVTV